MTANHSKKVTKGEYGNGLKKRQEYFNLVFEMQVV